MVFDWFRKKATRYAIVIALVSTLTSACKRELPKEEATPLSALAAQVEKSLKAGKPDKEKIKEFVRFISRAKKEYGINLQYNAPDNLQEGIAALSLFYEKFDKDNISLNAPTRITNWGSSRLEFVVVDYMPSSHLRLLFEAEERLGIRLEEERNALKIQLNLALEYVREELGRLERGEFKPRNPRYRKGLEIIKENFLEVFQKLN